MNVQHDVCAATPGAGIWSRRHSPLILVLFFPSSDLCLQTQPVPSPLSYYMHQSPKALHKGEVLTNHFVELLAPWLLLMPLRGLRLAGGVIQLVFQVGQSHMFSI